ncbi:MAG: polyketide cyclase [Nitrospirae bacterium GWC2_57_13]|nr:MAG: polyketide cyclase [Nitrospirae bacterium GWC1_57_7]OGW29777.1 MAG: polyketide cyclase [Nitrospirae bacterium GWC2_57_13]OGW46759.1 MAG: polyketide cyclase [Nitrospirae bacterium GWD2_57_8]
MTFTSRHISISINHPAEKVYEFVSNPENLPIWAAGLSGSIQNIKGEWIAQSPMGRILIKFAERNAFGILDHDVTLPSGESVTNAMRVVPNNDGSEVVFTLYQRPGMSDEVFSEDAMAVKKDLKRLKTRLEK